MTYEELLMEADYNGLTTKEKDLLAYDGRIKGNRVAIRKTIETDKEKACVLAEELGHYHTSYGSILDQGKTENRKQELKARMWAYDKMIGLEGIIKCFENQTFSVYEAAEKLGVTEEFMLDALEAYRSKYGTCTRYRNYIIYFEPQLGILKRI